MTYDTIATISQVTSLLMFIAMFAAVLAYALWPQQRPRASRRPSGARSISTADSRTQRGRRHEHEARDR